MEPVKYDKSSDAYLDIKSGNIRHLLLEVKSLMPLLLTDSNVTEESLKFNITLNVNQRSAPDYTIRQGYRDQVSRMSIGTKFRATLSLDRTFPSYNRGRYKNNIWKAFIISSPIVISNPSSHSNPPPPKKTAKSLQSALTEQKSNTTNPKSSNKGQPNNTLTVQYESKHLKTVVEDLARKLVNETKSRIELEKKVTELESRIAFMDNEFQLRYRDIMNTLASINT